MRILIATSFFPPVDGTASRRPYSWAKYWSAAGHDVTVITPYKPPGPKTKLPLPLDGFALIETAALPFLRSLKDTYENSLSQSSYTRGWLKQGLDWFRQTTGVMSGCRMPDIADLWVTQAMRTLKSQTPWDVVITTAPPLAIHRLGHRIKTAYLAKHWVMDYRDLVVGHPATDGLFPFNVLERWLERRYIESANTLTTVNHGMKQHILKRFPNSDIHIIESGYDPANRMPLPEDHAFPRDKKFRIAYLGSVYPDKQNPRSLFEAIKELSQIERYAHLLERLEVRFYGHRMGDVPALIEKYGVGQWVKVCGVVSHIEALVIQRDAHVLLHLPWTDPYLESMIPSKLFEHLASGTEIIAVGAAHLESSQHLMMEAQTGEVLLDDIPNIKHYLVQRLEQAPKKPKAFINYQLLEGYTQKALAAKMLDLLSEKVMSEA